MGVYAQGADVHHASSAVRDRHQCVRTADRFCRAPLFGPPKRQSVVTQLDGAPRNALPGSGPGRAAARPRAQLKAPGPIASAPSRRPSPFRHEARPRPMVRRLHRWTFLSRTRCAHRRRARTSTGPNPAGEFLSSAPLGLRQAQAVVPGDSVLFGVENAPALRLYRHRTALPWRRYHRSCHDQGEVAAAAVAVSEPGTET